MNSSHDARNSFLFKWTICQLSDFSSTERRIVWGQNYCTFVTMDSNVFRWAIQFDIHWSLLMTVNKIDAFNLVILRERLIITIDRYHHKAINHFDFQINFCWLINKISALFGECAFNGDSKYDATERYNRLNELEIGGEEMEFQ